MSRLPSHVQEAPRFLCTVKAATDVHVETHEEIVRRTTELLKGGVGKRQQDLIWANRTPRVL